MCIRDRSIIELLDIEKLDRKSLEEEKKKNKPDGQNKKVKKKTESKKNSKTKEVE